MTVTVLKKTPIHCVVAIHGTGGTATIDLAATLATSTQTPNNPIVNISGILWAIPDQESVVISRTVGESDDVIWTLTGADNFNFIGYADNRFNNRNIKVVFPTGATVIIECVKIGGYGDSQHLNQMLGE